MNLASLPSHSEESLWMGHLHKRRQLFKLQDKLLK